MFVFSCRRMNSLPIPWHRLSSSADSLPSSFRKPRLVCRGIVPFFRYRLSCQQEPHPSSFFVIPYKVQDVHFLTRFSSTISLCLRVSENTRLKKGDLDTVAHRFNCFACSMFRIMHQDLVDQCIHDLHLQAHPASPRVPADPRTFPNCHLTSSMLK